MRKRAKRPEWVRRIAAWEASGESAGEYAKKHGWNPRTLVWWKRKIARPEASTEVGKGFVEVVPSRKASAPEVPIATTAVARGTSSPYDSIEVVLRSGRILRVQTGANVTVLRALIGVLEES
ncbi:IS66 family insertion sequence element accessory protein TnpA [Pendulispora albinea]|uniref:IS66 family insertion sequence element accessory protein TnpA n=1 Tax=Pendulispora albinea TaxID=2741071 RepID=UPI00374E11E1